MVSCLQLLISGVALMVRQVQKSTRSGSANVCEMRCRSGSVEKL